MQSATLLVNGDFEGGIREWQGIGELTVAEGWTPWFVEGGGKHRPEYKPEQIGVGKGRVYQGDYATKQFTTYAKQDGGIYQEVHEVTPGAVGAAGQVFCVGWHQSVGRHAGDIPHDDLGQRSTGTVQPVGERVRYGGGVVGQDCGVHAW